MKTCRSTRRRSRVVGVISSNAELERVPRMRTPPDLFEIRLDRLAGVPDDVENLLSKIRTPLIITARHPLEGGAARLQLHQRRDLLTRFLKHAEYVDVELRSAPALCALLKLAKKQNVGRIISFHNFKSTPNAQILVAKAREAKARGANIFKVATRTDTPTELGRLLEFMTSSPSNLPVAVMGIGKLGAISRVLLMRAGSALIYASLGPVSDIEGQLSLQEIRALGLDR
jgi:3-dehydroquinate dehydratase I